MTQSTGAQNLNLAQQNNVKVRISPKTINGADDLLNRKIIELWTNKIPIAGSTIEIVNISTPIQDIEFPTGAKQKFETFDLSFLLTDKFETYITLRQWLERNNPFKERRSTPIPLDLNAQRSVSDVIKTANSIYDKVKPEQWTPIDYRDIYIELKDLSNINFGYAVYVDAFPTSIPKIDFMNSSSETIELTVSFKYLYMDIVNIDGESLIYCRN